MACTNTLDTQVGFIPEGAILAVLQDTDIPYAAGHEVMKMKILAAHERKDINQGRGDFDDVMALLKAGDPLTYDSDDEKEKRKEAFGKFINMYIEQEDEWTDDEWKKNTKLE